MTDDEQREHDIEKAKNAKAFAQLGLQVVNNAAYKQAMSAVKAQIFRDFSESKFDEKDVRDECWRSIQNLDRLEHYFNQVLENGKLAEETLKLLNYVD